jgi:hypothetical protein
MPLRLVRHDPRQTKLQFDDAAIEADDALSAEQKAERKRALRRKKKEPMSHTVK